MFNDLDETLRQVLIADVPLDPREVDIAFDRPTREWSSRLSKPTLNLFLFDIRERIDFRDDSWAVALKANGQKERVRPPRRIDCAYFVTAWAREPADEHRILAGVLACMYRQAAIAEEFLQGELLKSTVNILARAAAPDHLAKPYELWGVLDNELRASLTWVATAPMEVFAAVSGPMVRSLELGFTRPGDGWREAFTRVGGVAHKAGDLLDPVANARVRVEGTALESWTDSEGKFLFPRLLPGEYELLLEGRDGLHGQRRVVVPSDSYDLPV
ncbi:MAG: hypothetical protein C0506_13180 [Anaerolinea sp.]|nr:hypothetical protein [Anaerolinea sp.]